VKKYREFPYSLVCWTYILKSQVRFCRTLLIQHILACDNNDDDDDDG
jgi:hypothetical protein